MQNTKHFFWLYLLVLLPFTSQAQQRYNFPDTQPEFIIYVADILKKTQKMESAKVAEAFTTVWNGSGLNTNKDKIIQISKKFVAARATAAGVYTQFYSSLCNAVNEQKLNSGQIDEFLKVCEQVAGMKNARDITIFFDRCESFFFNKALYFGRANRLYATGNYKFDFIPQRDEKIQAEYAVVNPDDSLAASIREITGPVLRFENTDLIFATKFDSSGIRATKGILMLSNNVFVGKGGKFDWASVDLDPNQVYCEFSNYVLDVTKAIFKAPNVKMTYSTLFKNQIKGDFEFASSFRKDANSAVYPKFFSAESNISIPQLGYNMEYLGGFSLEGKKISSASRNPNALSMILGKSTNEGGDLQNSFRVFGKRFSITDSAIVSPSVRFSLYLGEKDSLYHASLQFKYNRKTSKDKEVSNEIQLVRDRNTAASNTPFINNHHEFYIDADLVRYNLEKDSMDIYMLSGSQDLRPAVFESFDYFNQDKYNQMAGVYDFHPLKLFMTYARKYGTNSFFAAQIAGEYRKSEGVIKSVAADLQTKGFLDFDANSGLITLGRKINQTDSTDLFISAAAKMKNKLAKRNDTLLYQNFDHDNYRIQSVVQGEPNASLSRKKNELVIRGIERFPISELLNVYIKPDTVSFRYLDKQGLARVKKEKRIIVYGGRNLYMERGEISVGNFRFVGQNFFLLYNEFSLEMPIIDKILFTITDTTSEEKEKREYGGEIAFKPGRMIINERLNKSGRKKGRIIGTRESYEEYPKLNIPLGGSMYFATDYRQSFAYDTLKIEDNEFDQIDKPESLGDNHGAVFVIDPIDADSLTTKIPIFPGRFVSNIFPTFKDELVPMPSPDPTMGFVHKAPKNGYPLYPYNPKVKGAFMKFNKDLIMSKDGLVSGGEITYLTTTLKAPEFVFMPDSLLSDNVDFSVKSGVLKGAEFADVSGKTAQLRWIAMDDKMMIGNKDEIERLENSRNTLATGAFEQRYKDKLFTLYSTKGSPMTLRGNIDISTDGLRGEGNLIRKDFTLLSVSEEPFKFGVDKFTAKNVEFRINSKARDPYEFDRGFFYANNKAVLLGNFVDVDIDLKSNTSYIKPDNEFSDFASLSLPYAEYRTSIKEATWDMARQTISMKGDSTTFFTSTIFGSEDYNEENLRFRANKAFYDIPNLSMAVEGIPYINSADASIVPKGGKAVILKDAEMQELREARVLIDTLNRYHRLFNGNIRINSRLDFEGDATYQFVNVKKDTFNIKFDKFALITAADVAAAEDKEGRDKNKQVRKKGKNAPRFTFAQGTVDEKDKFYITSRILYKGLIKMYANRRNLTLDGEIKLDLSTRSDYANWIPYKSDKGDSVYLNLEERTKIGTDEVVSGLHFSPAYDLYTTFLSKKQSDQDVDVALAKGVLDYNPAINEFKISPQDKRDNKTLTGQQMIYDDSKGSVYLEGKLNLWEPTLAAKLKTSGTARISEKEKTATFDLFLPFDMPLSIKPVLEMQKLTLAKFPEKSVTINKLDPINIKIAEYIGDKELKKFTEQGELRPSLLISAEKEMKKPLIFSKVDMVWNDEYKTFYSKGALHLFSIYDKIIDSDVTGYIEIRKVSGGDAYTVYLQVDPDVWFFFEWDAGVFSALASDEIFNTNLDAKTVQLAGIDKKEAFIAKFREIYNAAELPKSEKKEEVKKEPEKKDKDKKDKKEDDDGF
ncbi:MAG: hypothetical protein MUE85_15795 [Microscillaceae bacterium]|jgi:hypothetical protein|nr:hypothetical protein [Microscillaceae bacterium]